MTKHRNDVFHMAYLLRGEYNGTLQPSVKEDLEAFLARYDSSSQEWVSIQARLKAFGLQVLPAETLLSTIRGYYKL